MNLLYLSCETGENIVTNLLVTLYCALSATACSDSINLFSAILWRRKFHNSFFVPETLRILSFFASMSCGNTKIKIKRKFEIVEVNLMKYNPESLNLLVSRSSLTVNSGCLLYLICKFVK